MSRASWLVVGTLILTLTYVMLNNCRPRHSELKGISTQSSENISKFVSDSFIGLGYVENSMFQNALTVFWWNKDQTDSSSKIYRAALSFDDRSSFGSLQCRGGYTNSYYGNNYYGHSYYGGGGRVGDYYCDIGIRIYSLCDASHKEDVPTIFRYENYSNVYHSVFAATPKFEMDLSCNDKVVKLELLRRDNTDSENVQDASYTVAYSIDLTTDELLGLKPVIDGKYPNQPSPAEGERTIFFHWGTPKANADLLNAANYSFNGHAHTEDLRTSPAAWINEPLLGVVRSWSRGDAAGPGIYVSANPFDSSSYGNDLLVFNIKKSNGSPLSIPSAFNDQYNVRGKVDSAQRSNDYSGLPLIWAYQGGGGRGFANGWHVIYRPPFQGENINATFGPPSAEDVVNWWNVMKNAPRHLVMLRLAMLSELIDNHYGTTPATTAFLHRLLFDHGYEYLKTLKSSKDLISQEKTCAGQVLAAFQKFIPNDARTKYLETWLYK